MSDTNPVKPDQQDDAPIWGISAISKEVRRGRAATRDLLQHGALPGTLVGHRWVSTRNQLRL